MRLKHLLLILFLFIGFKAYCQQDVDFHLNAHLLPGKNIIKVKRDFHDPYLWVLAQNNEVYRVNSITLGVDDYTATFSAYAAGQQFVDIAGRSQDTVFIATNSTNVIEYKKGDIKVIGSNDGVLGVVNSIGFDYTGTDTYPTDNNTNLPPNRDKVHTLMIGTNNGMCHYDFTGETISSIRSPKTAILFEATYRSLMFSDWEINPDPGPVQEYPVVTLGTSILAGLLWYGSYGGYGNNVYSAYYTNGVVIDNLFGYDPDTFMNFYWGTEQGLFQNNRANSRNLTFPGKQYLSGIKVNKITSIFGLKAFGTSRDAGLIKENLLVGTDQGLYFSNSGYWKFDSGPLNIYTFYHYDELANKKINDICVNATSYISPICEDGVWLGVIDGLYLLKPDYAKYITTTTLNYLIQFKDQASTVSEVQICSGASTTATINAYIYNGRSIQWYKDGNELPGESKPDLNITQSGDYTAVVYDPCSADIHFESNHLKVTVITAPTATLNYPDVNNFCDGTTATFKVDPYPNFQYRWYKDGVLNGLTSNSINVTQNGKYKLEVSACSGNWVVSKEIEANFIKLQVPVIKTDKLAYCIGDNANLSVNIPTDASYAINWLRDGNIITANTNKTNLTTNVAGNYSVSVTSNIITCSQTSLLTPVVFNLPSTISLEKVIMTTLCDGQPVNLKATVSSGNVSWSTGETGGLITVKNSGNYTATVTSAAGCQTTDHINLQLLPNPVLNLQDATLCQFTQQEITLNAPLSFSSYTWNGHPGGPSFTTNLLGKVELTVKDANGCTASQTINITSYCTDIKLANTFTPNGDGINDVWTIEGINNDVSVSVKIYNRYGNQVFDSHGYPSPWDGTYRGSRLPQGTYYYIITAKAGTQVLSGSLTIIY
jgi:gliding motility-associated-like protein